MLSMTEIAACCLKSQDQTKFSIRYIHVLIPTNMITLLLCFLVNIDECFEKAAFNKARRRIERNLRIILHSSLSDGLPGDQLRLVCTE